MIKLNKLNAKGIAHYVLITGLIVALMIGSIGAYVIQNSKAESDNHCGYIKGYVKDYGASSLTHTVSLTYLFDFNVKRVEVIWGDGSLTNIIEKNMGTKILHSYSKNVKKINRPISIKAYCHVIVNNWRDRYEWQMHANLFSFPVDKCTLVVKNKCKVPPLH